MLITKLGKRTLSSTTINRGLSADRSERLMPPPP